MKKLNLKVLPTVLFIAIMIVGIGGLNAQNSWSAPKDADTLVNPLSGKEVVKAGKKLFKNQCVVCHGALGKGDGVAGMGLTPKPSNLTSEKVQSQTDGALFWKITNGNAPMASYKDILSEEQRWQLVSYIRTLKKK